MRNIIIILFFTSTIVFISCEDNEDEFSYLKQGYARGSFIGTRSDGVPLNENFNYIYSGIKESLRINEEVGYAELFIHKLPKPLYTTDEIYMTIPYYYLKHSIPPSFRFPIRFEFFYSRRLDGNVRLSYGGK